MNWTKISTSFYGGTMESFEDTQKSLNTIAHTLKTRRNQSSIWGRIELYPGLGFQYEVLIPGLKDYQITVLKDLGYKPKNINMSRSTRRMLFTRITSPKTVLRC